MLQLVWLHLPRQARQIDCALFTSAIHSSSFTVWDSSHKWGNRLELLFIGFVHWSCSEAFINRRREITGISKQPHKHTLHQFVLVKTCFLELIQKLDCRNPYALPFFIADDNFLWKTNTYFWKTSNHTNAHLGIWGIFLFMKIKKSLFSEKHIQSALILFGGVTAPSFPSANTVVTIEPCRVFQLLLLLSSTLASHFLAWSYNTGNFQMLSHSRIRSIGDWFTSKSKYEEVHSALSWPRTANDWAI